MTDENTENNIKRIKEHLGEFAFSIDIPALITQFSSTSFLPFKSINNFERFLAVIKGSPDKFKKFLADSNNLRLLCCLFSGSQYLSDLLIKHPEYIEWLLAPETIECSRFKDNMIDDLEQFFSDGAPDLSRADSLKRFKHREYIRLGLRDLARKADTVETLEDISSVADVVCQKAYEIALEVLLKKFGQPQIIDSGNTIPCEFTVLGLGKLGGRELNFSSDIDLIYIYSTDEGRTAGRDGGVGQISNREFFSFLARDITRILNDVTEEGRLYRVDLDLRPEGKSGNIASSLRSLEVYYESWGETWERQMLIKARPVAGSLRLAHEFKALIKPFVYRKYLDFSALGEIKAMKEKINFHLTGKRAKSCYDVKLGAGGIREAEFIIQSFQLVYGGKTSWFRKPNSMRTLHRISEKGLLSYNEYSGITRGYFFLRDLENRIQMDAGLQIHHIPSDVSAQAVLAKKMGLSGGTPETLAKKLLYEFKRHTEKIHGIYSELFSLDGFESYEESDKNRIFIDDYDKTLDHLRNSGFNDLKESYKRLVLLRDGTVFAHPTSRTRERFESILPALLEEMSLLPEPDLSLKNLESFIDSGRARDMVYMLFSQNRLFIKVLCSVFGFSRFLSNILIQQPELQDYLTDVSTVFQKRGRDALREEFMCALTEAGSYETSLDCIRKYKRVEELRIGVNEIIEKPPIEETFSRISVLADIYLEKSLLLVKQELAVSYGAPQGAEEREEGFAVIGLGKLGGDELNYGSDLDLVFVYRENGKTSGGRAGSLENSIYYTKLCQKFIKAVVANTRYGFGYKVDTRLRPEGEKGLLVMSLNGYETYYKKRGSIWERQALIKSRFIAGDRQLGDEFVTLAHKVAFDTPLADDVGKKIYEMRKKIETRSREGYDFKIGRGGVVDIEFSTQYLQMKWGRKYSSLRVPQTLQALRAIRRCSLADIDDIDALLRGYTFLRQIELKIRIDQDHPVNRLPANRAELEGLVKRLGKRGEKIVKPFLSEFEAITDSVRSAYENIFSRC